MLPGTAFQRFFWSHFSDHFLVHFWPPKLLQIGTPNLHLFRIFWGHFLDHFLGTFWITFGAHFGDHFGTISAQEGG